MADFRKPKYSGSLNLAPECGPVLIELDSVAKTATASLEDPASQYTLAGGGGSLDYVIPEQTFNSIPVDGVTLQIDIPLPETQIIIKSHHGGGMPSTNYFVSEYFDNNWSPSQAEGYQVVLNNGIYTLQYTEDGEPIASNIETTISAIRGF